MKDSDVLARKKMSNYIENDFYLCCESLVRKHGSTCILVKKYINKNIKNPCEWMTWGDIFRPHATRKSTLRRAENCF